MVWMKMWVIVDKIVVCQLYDNFNDVLSFINVIDLFVYKMVVVGIMMNNIGLVDVMINCY